jgi:elongation factor P
MLSVTELRKGAVFVEQGRPYSVLEYSHVKVGRGNATIKVRARDLKSGSVLEKSFVSGATVEEGEIEKKKSQFLYSDAGAVYFMDPQSFEQVSIPLSIAQDAVKFLKEGSEANLIVFQGQPIGVEIPLKVELKVIDTPPGEKGDTKQGGTKEATLETGYKIQVPLFMKPGEIVQVSTETGEYAGRVVTVK